MFCRISGGRHEPFAENDGNDDQKFDEGKTVMPSVNANLASVATDKTII